MDLVLPCGFALPAVLWVSALAALAGLLAGMAKAVAARRRAAAEVRAADARAAKERERAELAEKELRAERAAAGPRLESQQRLLEGLTHCLHEFASAPDRLEIARALGRAVGRIFAPDQWMVFLAEDREGRDFVLVASGPPAARTWEAGGRINQNMGRLGLVARRRTPLDRRDFESEPPIVRDQVQQTEPAGFRVDAAAPVLAGDQMAALVSVGGAAVPLDLTSAGLQLLAALAGSAMRGLDASARVARLENTDALTGLGNKSWFNAQGSELLYGCRMDGRPAALVVFGIDDFRGYVERNGHQAGDRLLKGVAEVIRPLCREGELLARWSVDEFMALLRGVQPRVAIGLANRVRSAVAAVAWPYAEAQPRARITMCAGVATLPEHGLTLDDLVEVATQNLAAARWNGGDTTGSVVVERITSDLKDPT